MMSDRIIERYIDLAGAINTLSEALEDEGYNSVEATSEIRKTTSSSFISVLHTHAENRKQQIIEDGLDNLRDLDRLLGLYNEIQQKR